MNINLIKEKLSCASMDCFQDDFFDNNFKKGIIKHVNYDGLAIEQNPNIIDKFNELISTYKPKRVLEIGTFHGGLTEIIRDLLDVNDLTNSEVKTYDVTLPNFVTEKLNKKNINLLEKNLFSHTYTDFLNDTTRAELFEYINGDGLTLVLCDGGSKKNEFRLISNLLKVGDIIMAHDYAPNPIYFESKMKNIFWNWLEIQDSDIEQSCLDNNLKPLLQESFIEVAWVCKIKE